MPFILIVLTIFTVEAIFVSSIENNYQVLLMALSYAYMATYGAVTCVIAINVIVNCSSAGRYTGVLIHQAILNTNDTDVMTRVRHFAIYSKK